MLKKHQIQFLQDLLSVHIEDAEGELEAAIEDNDGIKEAQEALDELNEISMALEVMKISTEQSDDIEALKAENIMLKKAIGEISAFADKISGFAKEIKQAPQSLSAKEAC